MAFENVDAEMVNTITSSRYSSQTADTAAFDLLKELYSVYVTTKTQFMPASKQDMALALLIAHHYSINTDITPPDAGSIGNDGGRGPITAESDGDVSRSYGTATISGSSGFMGYQWLNRSMYGQQFIMLMNSFGNTPLVL